MAQVVYKDHTIIGAGLYSPRKISDGCIPVAAISWPTEDGIGDVHLMRLGDRCSTEAAASIAALEAAKVWVDQHTEF
jgi:hypothetical protein